MVKIVSPADALAVEPIVATSSTTTSTQPSTMRHLVRTSDATLHSFVQMGTNTTKCSSGGLWWLYSTNSGTTWTCGGQISSDTTNLMYADARADSSDNIYIVYSVGTTGRNDAYDVLYRKISYNGSSSWTVNSAQTLLDGSGSGTAYHYSTIELEGTTRLWMATRYFDGTNYGISVYYSDSLGTAPTWTVSQATLDSANTGNQYHFPALVRFGSKIGVVYNIQSGSDMSWRYRSDSDGLTTWNSEVLISSTYLVRFPSFSVVGDSSGNVFLTANDSGAVRFSHYLSSWSSIASVSSAIISDAWVSVTTDGTGNNVWVVYGETTGLSGATNRKLVYKKGVSPFATANFDSSSTAAISHHGIFEKTWLYDSSANSYLDETTDAGDTDTADTAHSDSSSIVKDVGDIIYMGKTTTYDAASWVLSTNGTGSGTLVWEYCSAVDGSGVCTTWSSLTFTASSQTNLKGSGYGAFTPPSDWAAAKVNSESTAYYYIRGRATVAFTVGPVGTQVFSIPPIAWISIAQSNLGIMGIWTENSASVVKVRYSTILTHSTAPFAPTSLGGHVTGDTTADTTPSLTFTLDDPEDSDTVKFRIQIDDTSNFSSPVVDYTSALASQGSTSFTVGQAAGSGSYTTGSSGQTLANGNYYWRVKGIDNDSEESAYSTANSGSIAFVVDDTYEPPTWPIAGANAERTGWTSEELTGNIAAEWVKPIEPYISQHVQVIGADGKLFVSSAKGLYAFDASSGTVDWVYPTELPLGHSPTYSNGVLYVGGMDRRLYAINATTGTKIWEYETTGGFSTSPVVANDKVYAGNRNGIFYAINTSTGTLAWSYETGNQILQSAAYKAESDGIAGTTQGTLFFASNDGYAYALNAATGSLVWKSSSKLPSMGFYSWWPVIYENDVIFTRSSFGSGRTGEETDYLFCTPSASRPVGCTPTGTWTPGALGTEAGDWVSGTATQDLNNNSHGVTYADYYETFPHYRGAYFFTMATGAEVSFDIDGDNNTDAVPFGWSGDAGTLSPPIVSGHDGVLYFRTMTRASGGFGSKTIAGWKYGTGIISVPYSNGSGQSAGWPGDEPNGMTAAGDKIYWNHCCDRFVGAVDISQPNTDFLNTTDDTNRQWRYITSSGLPLTTTGIGMPDNYYTAAEPYFWDPPDPAVFWNENDKVGPTIYNGKMYVILGNALVAFSESGAGNSAPMLTTAASETTSTSTTSITRTSLTQTLEEEIQEMVDIGHLKPSFVQAGNVTSYRSRNLDDYLNHYWHNPADTQRVLIRALPFLSSSLQTEVRAYLQDELSNYSPATYAHIGFVGGTQRDPYLYPPDETDFNEFDISTIDKLTSSNFNNFWGFPPSNVYALWKYAEAGLGNASTLFSAWGSTKLKVPIENNFSTINGQTVNSSNIRDLLKSFPLVANAFIAGYKGYIELAILAGQPSSAYSSYQTELDKLLGWRAEDLLTFPDPQEPYMCENECYYESMITYYNFAYMTPELAEYLSENAVSSDPDKDIQTVLERYLSIAPYWMMGHNGETQGESAIQPYQQTHSLFQARAMVEGATFDELVDYLDTPIVPTGDLYYLDNVIATLEATSAPSATPTPSPTPASSDGGSSGTSVASAPSCTDTSPTGIAPWIYQANSNSGNSITIRFANWQTPVTHFTLEYGIETGQYIFAVSNIGSANITSYTINNLSPNKRYYFRIRTGNGCATGSWSNELSATTLGFFERNRIITQDVSLESAPADSSPLVCKKYTVKPGDTLWKIAQNILGDGNRFRELIDQNSENFPSLLKSNNLTVGWELTSNCEEKQAESKTYEVKIIVTDEDGNAVEGATVTIHSDPKTGKTDSQGVVKFSDVEEGDHKVIIAYDGYQGEQALNLTGDVKKFSLNVKVEQKNILLDPRVLVVFGAMSLIIVIQAVLLIKAKRKTR